MKYFYNFTTFTLLLNFFFLVPTLFAQPSPTQFAHCKSESMVEEHHHIMNLIDKRPASLTAINNGSWFNPSSWDKARIPKFGDHVVIPSGFSIIIDNTGAEAHTIGNRGALKFSTTSNTSLRVDTIVNMMGYFELGTKENPVRRGVTSRITFADSGSFDRIWDPHLLSRGFINHGKSSIYGDKVTAYGEAVNPPKAGETTVNLVEAPDGWQVGDTLVFGATVADTLEDVVKVTGVSGARVSFSPALKVDHTAPMFRSPEFPDSKFRFRVVNINRNIKFTSEATDFTKRGHLMLAAHTYPGIDLSKPATFGYFEITNMGRTLANNPVRNEEPEFAVTDIQLDSSGRVKPGTDTNQRGRYPVHFHHTTCIDWKPKGAEDAPSLFNQMTFGPAKDFLVQVEGVVASNNNAIHDYVTHGSVVEISKSVSYRAGAAGFFAESGSEISKLYDNVVISVGFNEQFVNLKSNNVFINEPENGFSTNKTFAAGGTGMFANSFGSVNWIGNHIYGALSEGFFLWAEPQFIDGQQVLFPEYNLLPHQMDAIKHTPKYYRQLKIKGNKEALMVDPNQVPIGSFANNFAANTKTGLKLFNFRRNFLTSLPKFLEGFNPDNKVVDSAFVNIKRVGVNIVYTSSLIFDNVYVQAREVPAKSLDQPDFGFAENAGPSSILILNSKAIGFKHGVSMPFPGAMTTLRNAYLDSTLANVLISDPIEGTGIDKFENISFGDKYKNKDSNNWGVQGTYTNRFSKNLVLSDKRKLRVLNLATIFGGGIGARSGRAATGEAVANSDSSEIWLEGNRFFYPPQHPDFDFSAVATTNFGRTKLWVPDQFNNKTISQIYRETGLTLGGQLVLDKTEFQPIYGRQHNTWNKNALLGYITTNKQSPKSLVTTESVDVLSPHAVTMAEVSSYELQVIKIQKSGRKAYKIGKVPLKAGWNMIPVTVPNYDENGTVECKAPVYVWDGNTELLMP